jgi:hypothetical protein
MTIPAPAADTAFSQAMDLGDCARILRERFPSSTSENRIEAIRVAQSRVIEKFWSKHRSRKKWWITTPERELPEERGELKHGR